MCHYIHSAVYLRDTYQVSERETMTSLSELKAEALKIFPNDAEAEKAFHKARWYDGTRCAHCNQYNVSEEYIRYNRDYKCYDCQRTFSLRSKTFMSKSQLGYREWGLATFLILAEPDITHNQLSKVVNMNVQTSQRMIPLVKDALTQSPPLYPFTQAFPMKLYQQHWARILLDADA